MSENFETDPSGAADAEPGPEHDFLVVGLGASAGGIQALREFFTRVPAESGMAYVVILHLSPDHDSQLAEVLQGAAAIPVTQVEHHVRVEPNHVYVIPPNRNLAINDGHLDVLKMTSTEVRRAPVDIFFRTLAESHRERAVSVVLSGTGANGSMGMKRIKERGGCCIVQDPREAEYTDMPQHSLATGLVDYVLPVAEIPAQIIAYRDGLKQIRLPEVKPEPLEQTEANEAALRDILTQLRVRTGHDFSKYKRATVLRRIARRMGVHGLAELTAYSLFMREHPQESNALLKDLLISVTNFFRDAEAFAALEREVIPKLFEGKTADDQVRVWVAGCATGEEAYTLAMMLADYSINLPSPPQIQVFATDIDEAAIAIARNGFYTLNDAADIPPERLSRYFVKDTDDAYRVRRAIRERILFAVHNVIKDPPFSHLDLATCRNLLIYLNPVGQKRVMDVLHFALNAGGYLMLGAAESVDGASDLYVPVDNEHRIYQGRAVETRLNFSVPDGSFATRLGKLPELRRAREARPATLSSYAELHHRLLERYAPPSVVVNEDYDVVHMSESAGRYMELKGGEPTTNLLMLIRPELRLELRGALYQATQRRTDVESRGVNVRVGDETQTVDVLVRPVFSEGDRTRGFILVIFEEARDAGRADESPVLRVTNEDEPIARQLEEELLELKAQLSATIEQHELQREELKASNEELQATNEEMRSAAEELETGKEELQSINEELTTVNQELKIKIEELDQTNDDFKNLINSTQIGSVFLDRALRVKLFTPRARDIFNLISADLGRPLSDITTKLEDEDLIADAQAVLDSLHSVERETRSTDGHFYLLQIVPYRTTEDRINGVVLSFFDITERQRAEALVAEDLRATQTLRELAMHVIPEGDASALYDRILDAAIALMRADAGTVQIIDTESAEQPELVMLATQGLSQRMMQYFRRVDAGSQTSCGIALATGERTFVEFDATEAGEDEALKLHVEAGYLSAQSTPLIARSGKAIGMISTHWREAKHRPSERELSFLDLLARQAADLIEQHQAQAAVQDSEAKYHSLFESMDEGYAVVEVLKNERGEWNDFRFLEVNSAFVKQTGMERPVGRKATEVLGTPNPGWAKIYGRVAETGEPERFEQQEETLDRIFDLYAFRLGGAGSRRVAVLFNDITESKRAGEALRVSEEKLTTFVNVAADIVYEMSPDWSEMRFLKGIEFVPTSDEPRTDWMQEYIPEDEQPRVWAAINRAIETRSNFELEHRVIRSDGAPGWTFSRAIPVMDDAGKIVKWFGAASDITERKRNEEALRESEQHLKLSLEGANIFTWEVNPRTGDIKYSANASDVLGFALPDNAQGNFAYIPPDERTRIETEVGRAMRGESPLDIEHRVIHPDTHEVVWIRAQARLVSINPHAPALLLGVTQNITERKRVEEALQMSGERLRLLVESAADYAIFTMTLDNRIDSWNAGAEKLFGWTEAEAIGQSGEIIFTPEDRLKGAAEQELATALREGRAPDERWHLRKDGSRFYVSGVMQLLRDAEGRARGFAKIARDMSAQRRAEEELRRTYDELEARVRERTLELAQANETLRDEISQRIRIERARVRLLRQIVRTQEDERRRVARDIHDQLGQQMTALRLNLETLNEGCDKDAELRRKLAQTKAITERLDADVDFLAWELRPAALDDIGLAAALASYVREWSKYSGVEAQFHTTGMDKGRLAPETQTNLYRITQEALNNIMKYARARHVDVLLERRDDQVVLIVEDDGLGFDLKKAAGGGDDGDKGMGLAGMRERAALVGGTLEVESKPREGTTIFARVPVKFLEEEAGEA